MNGNNQFGPLNRFERPFKEVSAPELSRLAEVPEWKKPDMDNQYGQVRYNTGNADPRQQDGFATTDYYVPTYREEDAG